MNAIRTVVMAYVVWPKTRLNILNQTTSYMSPRAPEARKHATRTPEPCRGSAAPSTRRLICLFHLRETIQLYSGSEGGEVRSHAGDVARAAWQRPGSALPRRSTSWR